MVTSDATSTPIGTTIPTLIPTGNICFKILTDISIRIKIESKDTKYTSLPNYLDLDCVDTGNWDSGKGHDCNSYANTWCQNGAANTGYEWTLGSNYNYPENNCCVCGKGNSKGLVMPFLYYNDKIVINI